MATKPALTLVNEMPSFDQALARILNLRTSILLVASPDASGIDMKLAMLKDEPAFDITLHVKADADHQRIVYALKGNPLGDYRFHNVEAKRDGRSATRWLITATVTKSFKA
jgi:hypothetical protein